MNGIMRKLRSKRGASITFALLLFLVCAMVSTVVIVAASTAGGRFSSLKEMDERYYAVTAVEERLCAVFDGKSAIVNYTRDADGEITVQSTDPSSTDPSGSLIGKCTAAYIQDGTMPTVTDLTYTDTAGNGATYTCTVTPAKRGDMLAFTVAASVDKGNSTGAYTLVITFAPTIKNTVLDSATGKTRATVTWKLNKIEKNAPTA